MRRISFAIIAACALAMLSACASHDPPSCDGGDRRSINSGKWSGTLSLACGVQP